MMTAKQKILKLMSSRYRTNAGHCIAELGLNPNTARGRLSELDSEGLVQMVCRGTPGAYSEYAEYVLTGKGCIIANRLADTVTPKKVLFFQDDPLLPLSPA